MVVSFSGADIIKARLINKIIANPEFSNPTIGTQDYMSGIVELNSQFITKK